MSALSSILRRLRAMPDATLIKKMSNIVPPPRPVTMANGKVIQPRNRIAEVLKSGPRKRRASRREMLEQPAMTYDDDGTHDSLGDFLEEDEVKYQQSRKVMRLLQLLKERGVTGQPPKGRR